MNTGERGESAAQGLLSEALDVISGVDISTKSCHLVVSGPNYGPVKQRLNSSLS
jgi:hypothetical protein